MIGRKSSMAPSAPLIRVEKEDAQAEIFKQLERIFSAGSSIDALKIFCATKDGIESSTQAIKKLGLTQKRYYTNLKRLIDVGLVEKVDGKYVHTTLGKIVYKLMEALKGALDQKDKLELVDRLLKAKSLSAEETEEIMRAILKDANIIPGERITDILGPVRMADTWEKVVQDVVEYIDKAEEEIFFASRYYDMQVMEAVLRASQRQVKMYFLADKEMKIPRIARIFLSSLLTNRDALSAFFNLLKSPRFKIKYASLPYSFIVVDREYSMVEVATPLKKTFSLAFLFHSKKLSERLLESFMLLWEKGSEVNILNRISNQQEHSLDIDEGG